MNIDINKLKEYIIDKDKIEFILESIGCHDIKEYTKEYRSGLPEHKNKTAVAINKETLSAKIFQSDSNIIRGDIITLIMHVKNLSFPQANKYLHDILGLKYENRFKKKNDKKTSNPLDIFTKIKKRRTVNVYDFDIYGEEILDDFIPNPHISLIRDDGIMIWTCNDFNIGYSPKHKRICFPERYWSGDKNTYIGVMGRTVIKEFEILGISKYMPIDGLGFPKSMNLYGLQENYKYIQEAGYVTVCEGQKSVLRRHSRNDKTCVAIGSHDVSDEQCRILISLNVDIVICFDKDISLQHIRYTCNKFYQTRNVYYIYDKWDILNKKDSPCDAEDKIYKIMFKYRNKYDEKEYQNYIKGK